MLVMAAQSAFAQAPSPSPRTYRNPILTDGNPADPHVLRVGDTYYLYATTHGRGYDAYTSKDLVNWEPRGSVFDDPRRGAWAPDVFHDARGDGKFYLYYTDTNPQAKARSGPETKQIGVAVADGPLGPFVDKKVLVPGSIDAHLFQDDNGRMYLYYVEIVGGFKIFVQPMADPLTPRGKRFEIMRPTETWEKQSGEVTEGPWMLKRRGTYYLMYSGTGADTPNYGIGYATSKSPTGPFKKFAGNPIVQRGGNVLGPGHHCVVEGPDGKLWMVYHQKYNTGKNWARFLAIDPLWFDDRGVIHARATRDSEEPAPRMVEGK
jgi:beta-xylosidase